MGIWNYFFGPVDLRTTADMWQKKVGATKYIIAQLKIEEFEACRKSIEARTGSPVWMTPNAGGEAYKANGFEGKIIIDTKGIAEIFVTKDCERCGKHFEIGDVYVDGSGRPLQQAVAWIDDQYQNHSCEGNE